MNKVIERLDNIQDDTLPLTNNQRARIERLIIDIVDEFDIGFMDAYEDDGYITLAFADDMEFLEGEFEPSDLTMFNKIELKETIYNKILKDFKIKLS